MTGKKAPPDYVIVKLYEAGQSTAAIGEAYNLHRTYVARILNRAGVTMRRKGNPSKRDAWAKDDPSDAPPPPRQIKRGAPPPNISGQPRPPKRRAKLVKITKLADLQPAQQDTVRAALEGFKEYVALRKVMQIGRVTA